jgi:hypothetical protein
VTFDDANGHAQVGMDQARRPQDRRARSIAAAAEALQVEQISLRLSGTPPWRRACGGASVSDIVGIAGSLLTIALTYANHVTKTSIDATQNDLQERSQRIVEEIRRRTAGLAGSMERCAWCSS